MTTTISPTAPVSPTVTLTARQRACVEQIARRQTNPQRLVRRAKVLLARDAGANNSQIARQMHLNRGTVCVWRHRWRALTPKLAQVEAEGLSDKALTTMIGFGTLMISSERGLASLGFILTLGVGCCMLSALVFLPAVLRVLSDSTEPQDGTILELPRKRVAG